MGLTVSMWGAGAWRGAVASSPGPCARGLLREQTVKALAAQKQRLRDPMEASADAVVVIIMQCS